jgi:hypothetical protein
VVRDDFRRCGITWFPLFTGMPETWICPFHLRMKLSAQRIVLRFSDLGASGLEIQRRGYSQWQRAAKNMAWLDATGEGEACILMNYFILLCQR